MKKFTCEECLAYCICPQKPKREDYADKNKYLIDLECGVWSCKNTVQKLSEENGKLQKQIEKMKCCPNCKSWDSQNLNFCEKGKRMCGYRACEEWEAEE